MPTRPIYIGTAVNEGDSIFRLAFDPATGNLAHDAAFALAARPTFLAVHPTGRFLYAVSELNNHNGKPGGGVSAFAIDAATGDLTLLNQQSSMGAGPCHLTVDPQGKNVLVANYSAGSVAVLPIDPAGRLVEASTHIQHEGAGADPSRQAKPHAHCIVTDPAGNFAYAADLGCDKVFIYKHDADTGKLTPAAHPFTEVQPGAGPRQIRFHPDCQHAYLVNELDSTVTVFAFDSQTGRLSTQQTLTTLPDDVAPDLVNHPAEICIHPQGNFVYASNRGHPTLAIYRIDPATGSLTPAGHAPTGNNCRHFAFDATGRFALVGNQSDNNIHVLTFDETTGGLTPTGQTLDCPTPICILPR